jgi:hypothetical protein
MYVYMRMYTLIPSAGMVGKQGVAAPVWQGNVQCKCCYLAVQQGYP